MSVDALEHAKPYQAVDGDTLETIAERESSSGNALTAEEISRFNWGTDDPVEVQTFMRDQLGARKRGADNRYIISTDDEPTHPLVIPRRFQREGLVVERVHTLRALTKHSPKQFLACCHIPGITFAFDKSFVRASVRDHLKELERLAQAHPEAKIMIFGHTDLAGSDMYNKKLSERRAWAVHAYIINDADAWETLYNHNDEGWGAAEIQEILAALGHDPGPIDGQTGSQTHAAMRSFLGLPEDAPVNNDAAFRRQLFAAYMAGKGDIDLPAERFADPAFMGCGEFNPVKQVQGSHEPNRRVTFFLFHQDRVPTLPCKFADVAPCHKQLEPAIPRHRLSFRCSFYDSLSRDCKCDGPVIISSFRIRLFDPTSRPILHAPYRLTAGEYTQTGQAKAISGLDPEDQSWVEASIPSVPDRAVIEWGHPADVETPDENLPYPYQLELHLDYQHGDDQAEQAKRRLHNLGYRSDVPLSENVRRFQRGYGLPETGDLDDETQNKLWSVHDACDPSPGSSQPNSAVP